MKKVKSIILFTVIGFQSFLLGDVTSSITSLVGRNAEGYLAPIGTMMGTGMNSGFYRKASPHKILGFDLTLDLAYAMAPAGKTTYNFIVPNDSVGYNFPFKFPKNLLAPIGSDQYNYIPSSELDETLYQDQEIEFNLSLGDILESPNEPAQNILGSSDSTELTITFDEAASQIFNQVIDNTWNIAESIPGIGEPYELTYKSENPLGGDSLTFTQTLPALYSNRDDFSGEYGGAIDSLIRLGLKDMDLKLPIPGGIGDLFNQLPVAVGLPVPILQASVGLPFHTELTVRGLPTPFELPGVGSFQYGGYGGKIGISEFFKKKPKKQPKVQISPKITYVMEELPTNITPADVDSALSELRTTSMDLTELDTLNYRFQSGDPDALLEIRAHLDRITKLPKRKKQKPKGWPIDVSLGYYKNDMILDFSGAKLNSVNRMYSLQAGKTFNLPWFLAFLGGVGIYGGLGYETSNLDIGYELANPLAYGCFSGEVSSENYKKLDSNDIEYTKISCTNESKTWSSGVPTDISLSFPGDNKFRKLIGARIRVLFIDAYLDYNMGTSNALNAGFGITFR
jgi:hypothetical protein